MKWIEMKQIQIEKLFILILQFREKKYNSYELPTLKIILKQNPYYFSVGDKIKFYFLSFYFKYSLLKNQK